MPVSDRGPEPRARPSSTVSAWSSRVWASQMVAWRALASASSAAYRACRAAASGPPWRGSIVTREITTSAMPSPHSWSRARSATAAESGLQSVVDHHGGQLPP